MLMKRREEEKSDKIRETIREAEKKVRRYCKGAKKRYFLNGSAVIMW